MVNKKIISPLPPLSFFLSLIFLSSFFTQTSRTLKHSPSLSTSIPNAIIFSHTHLNEIISIAVIVLSLSLFWYLTSLRCLVSLLGSFALRGFRFRGPKQRRWRVNIFRVLLILTFEVAGVCCYFPLHSLRSSRTTGIYR